MIKVGGGGRKNASGILKGGDLGFHDPGNTGAVRLLQGMASSGLLNSPAKLAFESNSLCVHWKLCNCCACIYPDETFHSRFDFIGRMGGWYRLT